MGEPDRSSARSGDVRAGLLRAGARLSATVPALFHAALTFCPSLNAAGPNPVLEIETRRETEPLSAPQLSATARVLQAAPETHGTTVNCILTGDGEERRAHGKRHPCTLKGLIWPDGCKSLAQGRAQPAAL